MKEWEIIGSWMLEKLNRAFLFLRKSSISANLNTANSVKVNVLSSFRMIMERRKEWKIR